MSRGGRARWSLTLLLAGCATPAPRVVPGWAPRVAAASPRAGATHPSWLEVDAEAVWWRSGDAGAERVALVALDAQGLPGDVALFTQRVRAALGARLRCDDGRVALEARVAPAARLGSLFHALAQLPSCVEISLVLAEGPRRPPLRLSRVGGHATLGVYRVARGWRVGMEGQFFAPGCHEAQDGGETVSSTGGDSSEALRACVRAAATAPSLRPWFSVQNRFVVAAPADATMGEVCAAASAFAEGMEPVARAALVSLAVTSSAADPSAATPPRPLTPPVHVPAHDQQLDVLRDALSACAADGGPLEVAGSFGVDVGRFVAARPIAGSPGARACAERTLGAVTLAPPQFARTDLVWRLPVPAERAPSDGALARSALASFGARMRRVRACYEAALRSDVQLGGRVEVEALVAGSGVVLGVTTRSTPSLGEAAACIADVLAASDGGEAAGGSFTLTFPVVLAAAR